jgi:putative hemolysin
MQAKPGMSMREGWGAAPALRLLREGAGARVRDLHADLANLPVSVARLGALEVKFAVTRKEIRKAQKLRWRVFFEEGGALADAYGRLRKRDVCPFDRLCDHLIVVDHDARNRLGVRKPKVVGCYRLLRGDVAQAHGGFYSAQEFDLAPLLARHPGARFLELGRSCVAKDYRSRRVLELLWRGLWAYARHHRIDAMIGCASLAGADVARHAAALAFLRDHASAPAEWRAQALPHRRVDAPAGARTCGADLRRSLAALPPLVKGYLRVGAWFGEGAVVDRQFGVVDVLVVLPVANIDPRYLEHFGGRAPLAA